jgi:ADP-heptose:LPS heptosyltransferase
LRLLEPVLGDEVPKTLAPLYPDFVPSDTIDNRLAADRRYILIHMGIGDYRSWPLENWLELGRALQERGRQIVFTGASGIEAELAGKVATSLGALSFAGKLSWKDFVTAVANAATVISVDTVTGHLAACFGIPTVTLLSGRWGRNLFRPNHTNGITLTHPVGCAPCYRSTGCAVMACVKYISTEEVLSAFEKITGMPGSSTKKGKISTSLTT